MSDSSAPTRPGSGWSSGSSTPKASSTTTLTIRRTPPGSCSRLKPSRTFRRAFVRGKRTSPTDRTSASRSSSWPSREGLRAVFAREAEARALAVTGGDRVFLTPAPLSDAVGRDPSVLGVISRSPRQDCGDRQNGQTRIVGARHRREAEGAERPAALRAPCQGQPSLARCARAWLLSR